MGATEAYITLEEAARLEGVSYNTLKSRTRRGKLKTKNETRESGGKDIILVKVNSLSKQARNAYREQERLKALAADSSDIQEEQKKEQPWYVDTDIDWYMEQYKERFYKAMELGNVIRQYLKETAGMYGEVTAYGIMVEYVSSADAHADWARINLDGLDDLTNTDTDTIYNMATDAMTKTATYKVLTARLLL